MWIANLTLDERRSSPSDWQKKNTQTHRERENQTEERWVRCLSHTQTATKLFGSNRSEREAKDTEHTEQKHNTKIQKLETINGENESCGTLYCCLMLLHIAKRSAANRGLDCFYKIRTRARTSILQKHCPWLYGCARFSMDGGWRLFGVRGSGLSMSQFRFYINV